MGRSSCECEWIRFIDKYRMLVTDEFFSDSYLDSKDATSLEYKLDSFASVYRRLTGKDVVFEFPAVSTD